MIWIYNISIRLYVFAIWLASFFNKKAKLWIEGRKGIFERLQEGKTSLEKMSEEKISDGKSQESGVRSEGRNLQPQTSEKTLDEETLDLRQPLEKMPDKEMSDASSQERGVRSEERNFQPQTTNPQTSNLKPPETKTIWMHVASLGEFEQGRPIIEALKKSHPDYNLLLTFFSPSGYEIRKNYELVDHVSYLPADTPKNARRFVEIVNPNLVIFVKYEFWYHYLNTLQTKGIPTILVSAIFRPGQLFFKPYGGLFKKILAGFDQIFVQNEASFQLLKKHNFNKVTLAGDTRIDRVSAIAKQAQRFENIERFAGKNKVLVCGSTWSPDETILADFIKKTAHWKFIIAPHEIKESNIKRLQKLLPENTVRFSQADENSVLNQQVLIIDNIGMLSSIYRYGTAAYIGGGFGKGIHNTLEPIAFGLPVIFGPKYKKFDEATTLVEKGGSFEIADSADFQAIMVKMDDDLFYKKAAQEARNYILENRGATEKIMKHISVGL